MKEQDTRYNEQELSDLEREIRKLGVPFADPAPDPQFWAQFRVDVMARVERKRGLAAFREWVVQHAIGSGLVGAGLAAAVVLALWGSPVTEHSSTSASIAQSTPSQSAPAQPTAPIVTPPVTAPAATVSEPAANPKAIASASATHHASPRTSVTPKNTVAGSDALLAENSSVIENAARPLLVSSESEYPVSLTELSDAELQSVYEGLLSLDSAQ